MSYVPHTDQLILCYDCENERVKINSHCKFDEDFNDVPTEFVPLGFQQLICVNQDPCLSQDSTKIASNDLAFFVYPFVDKEIITVHPNDQHRHFGFHLRDDEIHGCIMSNLLSRRLSTN